MRGTIAALLAALTVVAGAIGSARPATAQARIHASILFDLGDGEYHWADVTIEDPKVENASWNATRSAAAAVGLVLTWNWFECCGIGVSDIGNRNPPAGFVGLFLWNRTAGSWEFAETGISNLVLRDGDAIAWYSAAFDGVTFKGRTPVPTPANRTPSVMFRADAFNRAASSSSAPNTPTVLWDRDIGVKEIGSTPAVARGQLYFATLEGLDAISAETGATVWMNAQVKGFSSPAVFDESIFVGGSDGRMYRVNARNGTEEWSVTLLSRTVFSGIISSPKVVFDHVYVGTFNETGGPGEVVALWASNGTVVWRHATGSIHLSSPGVADGTVFVGVRGSYNTSMQTTFNPPYGVLALNAATGDERWFFPTGGSVAASPLVAGPRVIVPSQDGFAYAINRASGTQLWRVEVGSSVSSPAIHGDTLYVASGTFAGGGSARALDVETGQTRWTFTPNGPVQASITYADGKIFFSTNVESGTIYALDAETGKEMWTFQPRPPDFILGSPVVADGVLYAPSDNGHVYAFRDAASSPNRFAGYAWAVAGFVIVVTCAVAIALLWRRRRAPQ